MSGRLTHPDIETPSKVDPRSLVFSAARNFVSEITWTDLVMGLRACKCTGAQIEHVSGLYHELEMAIANCEGTA
ncbi:MAG: hypothetical protein M3O03_12220 [Pseudomonadota bacterium]|nr:hypothetical protein [Pseudomonadota bacterium]